MAYLPGVPSIWPGGLENIYKFNGLVLNDRKSQIDNYKITKIDGLFDADIRDSRDVNPSRHGETAFESFYGGKTITIEGVIRAGNIDKMRNMIFDLQKAFADLREHSLEIYEHSGLQTNTPVAYINCKKMSPLMITESQDTRRPERVFSITLRASNPFVYSVNSDIYTIYTNSSSVSITGRSYDRKYMRDYNSIYGNLSYLDITSGGNMPQNPVIDIFGPIDSGVITNYTNGSFVVLGAISNATLDFDNRVFQDVSGDDISRLIMNSSNEFILDVGVNRIGFGAKFSTGDPYIEVKSKAVYV